MAASRSPPAQKIRMRTPVPTPLSVEDVFVVGALGAVWTGARVCVGAGVGGTLELGGD
jgi:hypothetical protein